MIVEFIGLPASGKTTIAKHIHLQDSIGNKKVKYPLYNIYKYSWFKRNLFKSLSVLKYIVVNPYKSFKLYMAIFKTNQSSWADLIKVYFNYIFLIVNYLKYKNCDDIILFDEGFLHNMWAILYASNNKSDSIDLKEFIVNGCLPNIVIKVDCNAEIIIERLFSRNSNTRIEKEDNIVEKVKNSINEIGHIINSARSITGDFNIDFFSVDNSKDNDLNIHVENIISFILERLDNYDRHCNP
ncbi:hypothetical protein [Schinkia azotoformans]|uniref:hypothetical protein n=1 Tax=Schinkia azotoformans TaxID=1454 RepID=UPI002DBB5A49|nr:hypothetical protein [Schinkia azotoformans]MEC1719112.1 hypothetical protein [Schinkia azotoformans]MED4413840.1 hypothetical protein [Schinkia azotoformans]